MEKQFDKQRLHDLIDSTDDESKLVRVQEILEPAKAPKSKSKKAVNKKTEPTYGEWLLERSRKSDEDIKAGRVLPHEQFWAEIEQVHEDEEKKEMVTRSKK